jgi:hypothetical protein
MKRRQGVNQLKFGTGMFVGRISVAVRFIGVGMNNRHAIYNMGVIEEMDGNGIGDKDYRKQYSYRRIYPSV